MPTSSISGARSIPPTASTTDPSPPTASVPVDSLGSSWALEALEPADVSRRGQIFTPTAVVQLMLDLAGLEPGAGASILDPACGSGALLLGAAARVGPTATLHGIELDPRLTALARENLRPWAGQVGLELGDALSRADALEGRFDVVLSNPPYVAWCRIDPEVRRGLEGRPFLGIDLRGRPQHRDRQPDLGLFFLRLGLHALRPGGRLVFLLPPEWLTAERVSSLRAFLVRESTLRALLLFGGAVRLFPAAGVGGRKVQTGSMILVADRASPPPGHRLTVAQVSRFDPASPAQAARLEAWLRGSLPAPSPVQASRTERVQARLDGRRWAIEASSTTSRLSGVPLADVPGVRVAGGHQPPVAWLEWLELDATARDLVPEDERRWLVPAVREAREIVASIMPPPSRWWVFFPRRLDEAQVQGLAPGLYALVRRRAEAALLADVSLPTRWWEFPNPRNLELFLRPGPRLLAPRTAPSLRVSWDAYGHSIKGTNTVIDVAPGAPIRIEALFGLLSSSTLIEWMRAHGRPYHGVGVLQEPRELGRVPVPLPSDDRKVTLYARLEDAVRRILAGENAWAAVHRIATELYM